jgi:Tol biopolymer transport system component
MTQLNTQGRQPFAPDWSADGKKIMFVAYGEWVLYMMNPDGSALERIPSPSGLQENYPSFKPTP